MGNRTRTLTAMYAAMRRRFGHQNWWPGDTALEMCVGAILTQNTNWGNVARALTNLKAAAALDLVVLHEMPPAKLAELIRPAGYFNIKARRLKNFIARVAEDFTANLAAFLNRDVPQLRADLLAINGIGPETADSIILYAAHKPSFVVDAYTHRILLRHGLAKRRYGYDAIKSMIERALPQDAELWNDYHAQLVAVGKTHCRPRAICRGCPLQRFAHDEHKQPVRR
ncbi:MAG: hypothetical protein LLG01_18635 [Planctomycetaceae bacterium]|nr:hypothetical protein [Planctomycetaceae bacterium]